MKKVINTIGLILCLCVTALAQNGTKYIITGTVFDENSKTMPGVTIYLRDQVGVGTISDNDGKFSLKTTRGDMIIFSFIGYKKSEYLVTKEIKNLNIKMEPSSEKIDDVVVVGLGSTQSKISNVASISSVDVDQLQQPVSSVANLLGGRVAGVISMQSSGEPGKNLSEFWIRGIGTFGANASALVLIDGLEGNINSIDPADIESFSILKDASATAVYGVRGANGVVLITTKKGQVGKLDIKARANFTLSQLRHVPNYIRAYDYAKLANEAREVRDESPIYNDVELNIINNHLDTDIYPDVSWQDEVLKNNSFKKSYYVSARGGARASRYFLSLGGSKEAAAYNYDKSSPYANNVGYNTYSYRANIDLELSPSTNLYFGSNGFLAINNNPGVASTDYIWQAQTKLNPLLLPVIYSNGQLPSSSSSLGTMSPSVMINKMGRRTDQSYESEFTLELNQDLSKLVKGMKYRIQGAYNLNSYFSESRTIQPALFQAVGRDKNGELITIERVQQGTVNYNKSTNQYRKYHFEGTVNYDKTFNELHKVSGLIYYYMSDEKRASDGTSNLSAIPIRYQGISSRLTYGYNDCYLLNFNFGYTGSENFEPGHQFGLFPSIALGWVPTQYEAVKQSIPWLTFLKVRASYGTVGNDRISSRRFPYLTLVNTFTVSPWSSNGVEGISESILGADNLQWEKAKKMNLGIDGHLFNDKVQFVIDFFKDKRDGIFMQRVQVPDYAGLMAMPYGNIGAMVSYGADGNISYNHVISRDMSYTVRGNFSYSNNDVKAWEEANPKYPYLEAAGYPLGNIRGYHSEGLFKNQDEIDVSPSQFGVTLMPGDIKYKDVNGDGQVNTDDMTPLSYSTYPLLMFGFGGSFNYKKLSVGVLFKGTGKTDYFHVGYNGNGEGYVPFFNGVYGNVLTIANDPSNRWIPEDYAVAHGIDAKYAENPNARFPRLSYGYNTNNYQLSDFWKGDSHYLRLQEVTVNYSLKNTMLQKAHISSIDLQLVCNNLCVWDSENLFDPEQAEKNGEVYPIPATYTFQIYINL